MAEIRGTADAALQAVAASISSYEQDHPQAEAVLYRQNSVSIRVRIIDPDLQGVEEADRHDLIWNLFAGLSEDIQSQITLLLLLTPDETAMSFANYEFDHPVPTGL